MLRRLFARVARWLPGAHREIPVGVYAVHMIRPHDDRVVIVVIRRDPNHPFRPPRFRLYVVPRAYFLTDPDGFVGNRGSIEMTVQRADGRDGRYCILISLKRPLVAVPPRFPA
jgi:hypothetical protein